MDLFFFFFSLLHRIFPSAFFVQNTVVVFHSSKRAERVAISEHASTDKVRDISGLNLGPLGWGVGPVFPFSLVGAQARVLLKIGI